ncbi:hypothetical protein [Buttiauxella sp. S19-1]|uniref:hypothetical protein n=1 Tax=Buttiauxella sp. S19-1 TaxID=941430 RepID=UPI001EDBF03D|nr:hypothetical protein [Buttiauxella sp. S19-1]
MAVSDVLLDMVSWFLPDKKAESEGLEKFLILWHQEGHDPHLATHYFARATGHRYATYREIQLIMNTREPVTTIWMYKSVNRSQSVVRFNNEGRAEITDRARWKTRYILAVIDIFFVVVFLFALPSALNNIAMLLSAVKSTMISATLMFSLTTSIVALIVSALILLMSAFAWWDVLNAGYFADFYNTNRR